MVLKSSYRGVHSGNTLRGSSYRFKRDYHNQACIVSRIRPELLRKVLDQSRQESGDNTSTLRGIKSPENTAVDVALSLNKQSRWLLPSALVRQVKNNDFLQTGLTVSVLERHKLKRIANCVSFHSNEGEVKRIQPHNGRYFSFNFPFADGMSRRAYRRQKHEEIRKQKKGSLVGKTVEVFTEQGHAKRQMDIGELEVRYEVFYPSPASSSISHNPKYIKQDIDEAPGSTPQHTQQGKPKNQHRGKQRKRMTLKDIDDCDWPSYNPNTDTPALDCDGSTQNATFDVTETEPTRTTEYLFSSLIEKAERLQQFGRSSKQRRSRRNSSKSNSSRRDEDAKPHILYLSEATGGDDQQDDEVQQLEPQNSSVQLLPNAPSESTRVLLPTHDVTAASLTECFGQGYFEAACKPRKFVLDVSSEVRDLLKKKGVQAKVADLADYSLSYLIFIHDGFYNEDYDVYKVFLNSKLRPGLLAVEVNTEAHQDLFRGTVMTFISRAMDFVDQIISDLQERNYFPAFLNKVPLKSEGRQLKHYLGAADAFTPSVQRVFQLGSSVSDMALPTLSDMLLDDPAFCDVCYDDISPLTQDSAASTSLLKCGHRVCDSCWAHHMHSRLHQGFVRVTCPGYDCQVEMGLGVMLSVADLDSVEKLLQRQEEVRIGGSETEKWCPNQLCGRVLSLLPSHITDRKSEFECDVSCACGAFVCFQCLSPAHWPASCKQAEAYRTTMATAKFPDREAEVYDDSIVAQEERNRRQLEENKSLLVEGKHCPRCRSFVFKNGGCAQMQCRCGEMFCWYCAKPGYAHYDRGSGCVDVNQERKITTSILVRHLESKSTQDNVNEKRKTANSRQRVSLMERAAEHHRHRQHEFTKAITPLAKSVSAAAAKDKTLAQLIIKTCSPTSRDSPDSSHTPQHLKTNAQDTFSVMNLVSSFLKNAARTKQEMHEVVEYSLVLLKDLPDCLLKRRALRICEDMAAFCTFSQSIFDAWNTKSGSTHSLQEAVKAVVRMSEIRQWMDSALTAHVTTVKKLRKANLH